MITNTRLHHTVPLFLYLFSQGSTDSCHNNEAFEKGELDVVVKRVESTHIYDSDVMPAYKMAAYPRGLALIIEIEQFMNDVEKPRIGSHVSF